jgi:hypothetical protein
MDNHRGFATRGARMRLRGVTRELVTGLGRIDDRKDPSIRRREIVLQTFQHAFKRTLTTLLQDGVL